MLKVGKGTIDMCMSADCRREYISELCDRLIPNLEDELRNSDMKEWNEAIKDLVIRLRNTADKFRQCNKNK